MAAITSFYATKCCHLVSEHLWGSVNFCLTGLKNIRIKEMKPDKPTPNTHTIETCSRKILIEHVSGPGINFVFLFLLIVITWSRTFVYQCTAIGETWSSLPQLSCDRRRRCDVISFSRPSRNERDFAGFRSVVVPLRGSSVCRRRIAAVETLSRYGQEHDEWRSLWPHAGGLYSLNEKEKDKAATT